MKYVLVLIFVFSLLSCGKKNAEKNNNVELQEITTDKDLKVESKAVELTPHFQLQDDGFVKFTVEVRRNWKPTDEYIPSSELLRVEVFTESGKKIWSSADGKNFMQVINELQPQVPGYVQTYSQLWDARIEGKIISPGKYKALMTIPAKPTPYSTSLNFEWNEK